MWTSQTSFFKTQLHSYQILFRSVNGHKLLIIFQLSRSSKVCQLVHRPAIFPNLPHDVAWLNVTVYHSVFTQMVHSVHWGQQRKKWFRIGNLAKTKNSETNTHPHTAKLWGTLFQTGQRHFLVPPVDWAGFLLNNTPSPAPSAWWATNKRQTFRNLWRNSQFNKIKQNKDRCCQLGDQIAKIIHMNDKSTKTAKGIFFFVLTNCCQPVFCE